jgi:hypothetical protein
MFSNNQTDGNFKNIAQLMFLNEAIGASEKRVAQILVQTGGTLGSGKMYIRMYDGGTGTNALAIRRDGTIEGIKFPDGYTQTTAFMGASSGGANNTVGGSNATVGGGHWNDATANQATVGGGGANVASALYATVGGGEQNTASADGTTVGGGGFNLVTDEYGTIGGGYNNQAGDDAGTTTDAEYATVGGGNGNTASGIGATVAGGGTNTASGTAATVAGGSSNAVSGTCSAVGGGANNVVSGICSTVGGGWNNTASGDYSFAAGRDADADHDYSFVWGDSGGGTSFAANTFNVHASGGIYYEGGAVHGPSDRNKKENFEPVDAREVLAKVAALPMSTWNYRTEDGRYRHMGPMGQDFHAAFGLGSGDKHITTVDADGVALAAIQGLNQKLDERDVQIVAQQKQITALESELKALKVLVERAMEK